MRGEHEEAMISTKCGVEGTRNVGSAEILLFYAEDFRWVRDRNISCRVDIQAPQAQLSSQPDHGLSF